MNRKNRLRIAIASVLIVAGAARAAWAHDVLYRGTVLAVESTRLHVRTIDEKSRKEEDLWFSVNRETKVRRGEKTVTYTDARVERGERIVVIVNHDAKVKNVATEIRLAARPTAHARAMSERAARE